MALFDNNGGKDHEIMGHGHVGRSGKDGPGPGTSGSKSKMMEPKAPETKMDEKGGKKGKAETQY
jgi:hypothetical protein